MYKLLFSLIALNWFLFPIQALAQSDIPNTEPTFRATFWGDDREKVKEFEKTKLFIDHENILVYKDSAFGVDVLIKYLFKEDSLYEANYVVIEDFDFEEALRDIHIEIDGLNAEAAELAATIKKNLEELIV